MKVTSLMTQRIIAPLNNLLLKPITLAVRSNHCVKSPRKDTEKSY